jgi:hypothetical protein
LLNSAGSRHQPVQRSLVLLERPRFALLQNLAPYQISTARRYFWIPLNSKRGQRFAVFPYPPRINIVCGSIISSDSGQINLQPGFSVPTCMVNPR